MCFCYFEEHHMMVGRIKLKIFGIMISENIQRNIADSVTQRVCCVDATLFVCVPFCIFVFVFRIHTEHCKIRLYNCQIKFNGDPMGNMKK